MKGLQLGGILNILRHHKSEAVTEFVYSDDHLSPAQILNMFVIKYSEDQKKKRERSRYHLQLYSFLGLP